MCVEFLFYKATITEHENSTATTPKSSKKYKLFSIPEMLDITE
jgi:hypothetical protein